MKENGKQIVSFTHLNSEVSNQQMSESKLNGQLKVSVEFSRSLLGSSHKLKVDIFKYNNQIETSCKSTFKL